MRLQLQEILASSNQSPFAPHENPLGQKSENREVEPCGEMVSEKTTYFLSGFNSPETFVVVYKSTGEVGTATLYPCAETRSVFRRTKPPTEGGFVQDKNRCQGFMVPQW